MARNCKKVLIGSRAKTQIVDDTGLIKWPLAYPEKGSRANIDDVVVYGIVFMSQAQAAGVCSENHILFDKRLSLIVVGANSSVYIRIEDVVNIVASDDIAVSRTRYIDASPVSEHLGYAIHFVVFNQVVLGM